MKNIFAETCSVTQLKELWGHKAEGGRIATLSTGSAFYWFITVGVLETGQDAVLWINWTVPESTS